MILRKAFMKACLDLREVAESPRCVAVLGACPFAKPRGQLVLDFRFGGFRVSSPQVLAHDRFAQAANVQRGSQLRG